MSAYTDARYWYERDGEGYRVIWPLRWEIGRKGGPAVVVPIGFRFDVSVPSGLRWAVDPHDPRYLKAAAIHDWLLEHGWDWVTAAAIFNRALRADGVGRLRRLVMWLAVSLYRWR